MSENISKKNNKYASKKAKKIFITIVLAMLVGALYVMSPLINEFKDNLFNDSAKDQFIVESDQHNENNDNENEIDENLSLNSEMDNNLAQQTQTSAITNSKIEANCKKYALFINNFVVLQERIITGKGFAKEINELISLKIADAEIKNNLQQLAMFAEVGVPTFRDLRDEFYSMADEIIRSDQLENETNKMRKKALKFFQELIFIKKVGERAIKKGGIEGIVQNIKNLLENEELTEAILEAKKINNHKVNDMINSWIQDCKNFLKLQEFYENFKKQVLEKKNCSSFVND